MNLIQIGSQTFDAKRILAARAIRSSDNERVIEVKVYLDAQSILDERPSITAFNSAGLDDLWNYLACDPDCGLMRLSDLAIVEPVFFLRLAVDETDDHFAVVFLAVPGKPSLRVQRSKGVWFQQEVRKF